MSIPSPFLDPPVFETGLQAAAVQTPWYPKSDSNRQHLPFKGSDSNQLAYSGVMYLALLNLAIRVKFVRHRRRAAGEVIMNRHELASEAPVLVGPGTRSERRHNGESNQQYAFHNSPNIIAIVEKGSTWVHKKCSSGNENVWIAQNCHVVNTAFVLCQQRWMKPSESTWM